MAIRTWSDHCELLLLFYFYIKGHGRVNLWGGVLRKKSKYIRGFRNKKILLRCNHGPHHGSENWAKGLDPLPPTPPPKKKKKGHSPNYIPLSVGNLLGQT